MTDLDVEDRECISFTVSGNWAHFRRIDTTNDKQTYRVIPRTTAAGLIAAMLGLPRDSYYEVFSPENSAMSVELLSEVRTMQVPMLTLPTASGDITTAENVSGKTVIKTEEERKRRSFEYIRDPKYRIHVVLDDDQEEIREELKDRLGVEDGVTQPVYTPSLGKTECLAEIENPTVSEVEPLEDVEEIDSVVPENKIMPKASVSYSMERSPGYMSSEGRGRKTTGFVSYAYPKDGGSIEVSGVDAYLTDGSQVCFY
ncbi:MAG: type I-B CRISPR-associated protein Cas5b [Halobacteria archaeon]|nr:type I-B CRISPR-associated protein Cas5b [Halobacteria archaeon]